MSAAVVMDWSERGDEFAPRGGEQVGCSVAPGCKEGWRQVRRQPSPNMPTEGSTQKKKADTQSCTNARFRRVAFRSEIVRDKQDCGSAASSWQSPLDTVHHLEATTSRCGWQATAGKSLRLAPSSAGLLASNRVRNIPKGVAECRRQWKSE